MNQVKLFIPCSVRCIGFFILLIAFISLTPVVKAQSTKPDFSGNWKLNKEKSTLAYYSTAKAIAIEQSGNDFIFHLTYTNTEGRDTIYTFTYLVDGERNTYGDEYGEDEAYNKWSDDGKSIIFFHEYVDYEDESYDEYERYEYKLSDDLKTLILTYNPDYSTVVTAVYEKESN
jgi:hypothetical protein